MRNISVIICSVVVAFVIAAGWMMAAPSSQQAVQVDRFLPARASSLVIQSGTTVKIQPESSTINKGETIKIDILVENVSGLVGADISIGFDPAILQAQDADPSKDGIQFVAGTVFSSGFPVANTIDNGNGTGNYAAALFGGSAIDGTSVLASITFEAVTDGNSSIVLSKVALADGNGQEISAQFVNGTVQVGQGSGNPPTATPTPTVMVDPPTETPTTVVVNPATPTPTPVVVDPATPTPTTIVIDLPTNTPTLIPTIPSGPTATPYPVQNPPAAPPPITNIPPGASVGFCYRVQYGDTLSALGLRFGIDYETINIANQLWPPNHIYANQAIFIPQRFGHGPNYYIVRSGDTLNSIAYQCNLPTYFVARVNRLPETSLLSPGQLLRIPIPPFAPPSRVSPAPRISPHMPHRSCCSSCSSHPYSPCTSNTY